MSCGCGHFRFLIRTKNYDTVRDYAMLIHVHFDVTFKSLVFEKNYFFIFIVSYVKTMHCGGSHLRFQILDFR